MFRKTTIDESSLTNSRADSEKEDVKNLVSCLEQDEPDFDQAADIIDKHTELAYQTLQFKDHNIESSIAVYLTHRFTSYENIYIQNEVCRFIDWLNGKVTDNFIFNEVRTTINKLTKRDQREQERYKELLYTINGNTMSTDSSSSEHDNNAAYKMEFKPESANYKQIVEHTIRESLKYFDDDEFNNEEVIQNLLKKTMGYAKKVSIDQLTEIVLNIENTIKNSDDPVWEKLRQTVGMIVNKTAEHYIHENRLVDLNFKWQLLLCLTIIGALIPLLYYHLKVKPTHADAPPNLTVYEMSLEVFENTENDNDNDKKELDENSQTHLTNKHGFLKPVVLMKSDMSKVAKQYNGTLRDNEFASRRAEVRWIALNKDQAERIEQQLEGMRYKKVLGAG